MVDINSFFTDDEKEAIKQSVADAEKSTSAEIVPVLTDASGSYDRAEDTFGLMLAIVSVAIFWTLFQGTDTNAAWSASQKPALVYNLLYIILTITVAFIVGAAVASRVWFIRNLFSSRGLMKNCVQNGATRAFQIHNLSRTKDSTGVLIYISHFEHMVHVLGDSTVAEKLTDADFQEVRDAIIQGFRSGKRGDGVCEGIKLCGEKLAAHFQIKEGDEDELPNDLVIWNQNL